MEEDKSAVLWYGTAQSRPSARQSERVAQARSTESGPDSDPRARGERVATVWLFGALAIPDGPRTVTLRFPSGTTARDFIRLFGEKLGCRLANEGPRSAFRISVDGRVVEDMDRPLDENSAAENIELVLLPPIEGG
jgi:hypothetical protein